MSLKLISCWRARRRLLSMLDKATSSDKDRHIRYYRPRHTDRQRYTHLVLQKASTLQQTPDSATA